MQKRFIRSVVLLIVLCVSASTACAEETKPQVGNTAIVSVPKLENDVYDWFARHEAVLEARKTINPEIVLIGDSITHFWAGEPVAKIRNGPQAWKATFGDRPVLNLGFGWDRTQNVLWRIEHGEFDDLQPKFVVLNIGTNNFSGTRNARENTPAEVAEAIGVICERLRAKSPRSKFIVMGVFPRGQKADNPYRSKILALNKLLEAWAVKAEVTFLDIGAKMLEEDGSMSKEMMRDFVHPSEKGYAIWGEALKGIIEK